MGPTDSSQSLGKSERAAYEKEIRRLKAKLEMSQQQLRDVSTHFTQIEVELLKTKVELVNTVDRMNDLDLENMQLKEELTRERTRPQTIVNHYAYSSSLS